MSIRTLSYVALLSTSSLWLSACSDEPNSTIETVDSDTQLPTDPPNDDSTSNMETVSPANDFDVADSIISADKHIELINYLFDIQTGERYAADLLSLPRYSNPDYEDVKAATGYGVAEGHGRVENEVCENGGSGRFTAHYQGYNQRTYGWDFEFNNCQDGINIIDGVISRRDDCNQYRSSEGLTISNQNGVTHFKGETDFIGCGYRFGAPHRFYRFTIDEYSTSDSSTNFSLTNAEFSFTNAEEFQRSMVGSYTIISPETNNQILDIQVSFSRSRNQEDAGDNQIWGDNSFATGSMTVTAANGDSLKLNADNGDPSTMSITITSAAGTESFEQPWSLWDNHLEFGSWHRNQATN